MKLLNAFLDELPNHLLAHTCFSPYPKWGQRNVWENLSPRIKTALIQHGTEFLDFSWPSLLPTIYMQYKTNGNRSNYEAVYFERRRAVGALVIAECIEGKGRFIDQIINGAWLMCEETTWTVPAHYRNPFTKLPTKDHTDLDLFAADTGHLLAWVYYLMEEPLLERSPMVYERIELEIQERILQRYLQNEKYGWMGFTGNRVNNWNPWINSNVLSAALLVEETHATRVKLVTKIMRSVDNFINSYGEDGGCDEGPGYWFAAGGALLDALELMKHGTAGYIDLSDNPLIRNIGTYLPEMHIHQDYYVNFADAPAKFKPMLSVVLRYGDYIRDDHLYSFAASLMDFKREIHNFVWYWMFRVLSFSFDHAKSQEPLPSVQKSGESTVNLFKLFPDTQVAVIREFATAGKGFFLAVKGGHNGESHNHNDVGNFIIYHGGLPVLIDVGVETYTRETFSADRYKIWTMQSAYHNLPTINGVLQQKGKEFGATRFNAVDSESKATVLMQLENVYPAEAELKYLKRSLVFSRSGGENQAGISVNDEYECGMLSDTTYWSFMTQYEPHIVDFSHVELYLPNGKCILIEYPKLLFTVESVRIPIEDPRLSASWGNAVYRLKFTPNRPALKGQFVLTVREDRPTSEV